MRGFYITFLLLAACGNQIQDPDPSASSTPTNQSANLSSADQSKQNVTRRGYELIFSAEFMPGENIARARITVHQSSRQLIELDLNAPLEKYTLIEADGDATHNANRISWHPPTQGGQLVYDVKIRSTRGDADDAQIHENWSIVRLEDIFPPMKNRRSKNAIAASKLMLSGPGKWSFETRYGAIKSTTELPINPKRHLSQPTGWLVAGHLGIRRETIAERKISVAAPKGSGFRRLDVLTFLNWTLPELAQTLPTLPPRLLIVGAPEHMWRGGLSAPGSLYLHNNRPLVSENATSSILHELMHTAGLHSAVQGGDWIVEGLAEYYSLVILRRSGGISQKRFESAIAQQNQWAISQNGTLQHPSKGANTAFAVTVLDKLANELQASGTSLDRVLQALVNHEQAISPGLLNQIVKQHLGHQSQVLQTYIDPEQA